jgi:hypothetical protein
MTVEKNNAGLRLLLDLAFLATLLLLVWPLTPFFRG